MVVLTWSAPELLETAMLFNASTVDSRSFVLESTLFTTSPIFDCSVFADSTSIFISSKTEWIVISCERSPFAMVTIASVIFAKGFLIRPATQNKMTPSTIKRTVSIAYILFSIAAATSLTTSALSPAKPIPMTSPFSDMIGT